MAITISQYNCRFNSNCRFNVFLDKWLQWLFNASLDEWHFNGFNFLMNGIFPVFSMNFAGGGIINFKQHISIF